MLARPDRLPVLAALAMLGALADLQAVRRRAIAVSAARTAGAVVVDSQLELAHGTLGLDHRCDGSLSLVSGRWLHHSSRGRLGPLASSRGAPPCRGG